MWQRIWTWIRSHWLWMAGGATGLLAIVGLLRGRRAGPSLPGSAPAVGLSPEQASAARAAAQAERDREVAAAGQDLQGSLTAIEAARARKKGNGGQARTGAILLLLGASLLGLAACRTQPRPDPGPPAVADTELARLCSSCLAACEALPGDEGCQCAEDCAWARHAATVARADLRALQATSAADAGELTRRLQLAHQETQAALEEVDDLRGERWIWGAVGLAAGAVIVGLVVGLGR